MADIIDTNKKIEKIASVESNVKDLLINSDSNKCFDLLLSLFVIINNIHPSYISPAYHLNRYNELLDDPYSSGLFESVIGKKRHAILQLEFQNTLISIKGLLDRLVKIIALHYKGINRESTFGHYDEKSGKSKGLMSYVIQKADNDELMKHIFQEYNKWIKRAVKPRNKVIHYNDMPVLYKSTFNPNNPISMELSIVHLNKDLYEGVDIEQKDEVDKIALDREDLFNFVDSLYKLFDFSVNKIIGKILNL